MIQSDPHTYAVIMAGGSGTRFWPVSRGHKPKQLSAILGQETMIQMTVARLQPFVDPSRILVITTVAIAEATRDQLPQLPSENVIAEPVGRDTAACVCLAAHIVKHRDPDGVMVLLPADQLIEPARQFQQTLAAGVERARQGGLVTYGITPRFPATGYGYVHLGEQVDTVNGLHLHAVHSFVEKPDQQTAQSYVASGDYAWNSGIFTWRADYVLAELDRHCSWLSAALAPVGASFGSDQFDQALADAYGPLQKISIDYALMEKAENIYVFQVDFMWDDVGSWDALCDHLEADDDGIAQRGPVIHNHCQNTLLFNDGGPLLVTHGMKDVIVVSTADAVLVCPKGQSQAVKALYQRLQQEGHQDLL